MSLRRGSVIACRGRLVMSGVCRGCSERGRRVRHPLAVPDSAQSLLYK